jgi:hypothetical protein
MTVGLKQAINTNVWSDHDMTVGLKQAINTHVWSDHDMTVGLNPPNLGWTIMIFVFK